LNAREVFWKDRFALSTTQHEMVNTLKEKKKEEAYLLLVEDSDDDAFFFRRALEKSGNTCALHHVTDGAQAIDFIQKASISSPEALPSVIFLDLKMPVLNGFEVLDWLQTQTFGDQVRVIVLSGSEHQDDKDRAARLGASDYLVKPINASDLNRLLQDVCPAIPEKGALS
jgi:CheY-like chemotaxis protein